MSQRNLMLLRTYRVFKSPCSDLFSEVWLPLGPMILVTCIPLKHVYRHQSLNYLLMPEPLMQISPSHFPIFLPTVSQDIPALHTSPDHVIFFLQWSPWWNPLNTLSDVVVSGDQTDSGQHFMFRNVYSCNFSAFDVLGYQNFSLRKCYWAAGVSGKIAWILGVYCGEPFQAWEMWLNPHSEKPVGSEVVGQDPRPWIRSPVGNQVCIVPCYEICSCWNSLTLNWGNKCLLSIFIFLKSVLNHPSMEYEQLPPWVVTCFPLK